METVATSVHGNVITFSIPFTSNKSYTVCGINSKAYGLDGWGWIYVDSQTATTMQINAYCRYQAAGSLSAMWAARGY